MYAYHFVSLSLLQCTRAKRIGEGPEIEPLKRARLSASLLFQAQILLEDSFLAHPVSFLLTGLQKGGIKMVTPPTRMHTQRWS